MERPRQESEQLPEEAPAEQVPDDTGTEKRRHAGEAPGAADSPERATGNESDSD